MIFALFKALYFWTVGWCVTLFWVVICGFEHGRAILARLPRDGRRPHRVAVLWGRSVMHLMPGWRVTVTGREHLVPDGTASVIVANHESMADVWAMYYLGVQFRWLGKAGLFKIPVVGAAMRWCRYVPVHRGDKESGSEAMRASAERLAQGLSMFLFPEGTRSEDGLIKPFKLGAFRLAQGAQVPVQPIAIHGARDLLPKGSFVPNTRAHVQIRVLPPLPPPGPDEDLTAYAAHVRDILVAAHTELKRCDAPID